MESFLLDTVILSQPDKPLPHSGVMRWLKGHDRDDKFISVVSIAEIRAGIVLMPAGRKRSERARFLDVDIPALFPSRILPISPQIADDCGKLLGDARKAGFEADPFDAVIAATARVHGLTIVTLNLKHFRRLQVPLVQLDPA